MIKSAELVNFQSHENTRVEFDPGLNVFIGDSDSGKTSIIRMIEWVRSNSPSGGAFVRRGEKECIGTLEVEGHKITKRRASDKNTYNVDGELFEAVGRGEPPKRVSDILNMGALNVQTQFEAPFLLAATSGEVAKHFNNLVNLSVIDSASKNAISATRQYANDIKAEESALKNLREEKENLPDYSGAKTLINRFDKLKDLAISNDAQYRSIKSVLEQLETTSEELGECFDCDLLEKQAKEAENLLKSAQLEKEKGQYITKSAKALDTLQKDILKCERELVEDEKKLHELIPDECPLCGRRKQ